VAICPPDPSRLAVVYVTAPPKGSPKKLATQFAHFLGMPPFKSRANEMDIATVLQVGQGTLNAALYG
jgi:hypothetical protein